MIAARDRLGWLLVLFVASRLMYVVLIDPGSLLIYPSEELYRGVLAHELITGLTLPFTEYRADNYSGGSLVIGALAAGFFLLFGPTLFALKLAPLFLFLLTLVFWYLTIQRHASEREAGYFAMLFCFSPPALTAYSVSAMGFHSESIVFSALTVFLLFRMLVDEPASPAVPVLLGLTTGVGLWFAYVYGLTLLAMLGFWLWHEKGLLRRSRVLWFALGFLAGFSPWIIINLQTHFAGLVVQGTNVWEYFRLAYLWDGLANPRRLALYEFFAGIASDDPQDFPRRAVNLLYSLLFLGPILAAGVLRLKTGRSIPPGPRMTRPTLVRFGILFGVVFALAMQFSEFRSRRYYVPAYPFLFFLTAHSLARCLDGFPLVQRQIQTVFLASVVALGLGTHAPLLSLDQRGFALSAKGYSYAWMPTSLFFHHAPAFSGDPEFIARLVQWPLLSDVLPKLSSEDQRELTLAIVGILAETAPVNVQAEDFARLERLVPPGYDRHFYYQVGVTAMDRHPHELPKAITAVKFLRNRSAAAHHLALVGIYRQWALSAALDSSPEAVVNAPAGVAPALAPHYWRALGYVSGRSWYDALRSLILLSARLQSFVPRLDPPAQRAFLQGVGEALYTLPHAFGTPWVPPAELERFPQPYQEGLLEGWGMALGEEGLFFALPLHGQWSSVWTAGTKGLSAKSLVSVQRGKAQFEALFEGPAPNALKPPLSQ